MSNKGLKIKINVIWDKQCKDGEVLAEIFYRYFCSGELSVIPSNVFSIPVRCYPLNKAYSKNINCTAGYLTVNVLLADFTMYCNDKKREFISRLEKKDNNNYLFIPVALNKGGMEYIHYGEAISLYSCETDSLGRPRDKIINTYKKLFTNPNNLCIVGMLRKVLERIAGKYCNLVGRTDSEQVKLFVCHTKSSGTSELGALQSYLARETQGDSFVDKNSILYGEQLDKKIIESIKNRAMLVLWTDGISNREWCLKEITTAKSFNMPVIIVDALKNGDNRMFPYIGNCPVVKINGDLLKDSKKTSVELGIVYESLVNEILWNTYNINKHNYGDQVAVYPNKPELLNIATLIKNKYKKVIYPEPPMGITEKNILDDNLSSVKYKLDFETEISAQTKDFRNLGIKVMISSSSNPDYMRVDNRCCCVGINYAVKELCRYLVYSGCTILNAGNYEDDGFNRAITEQIKKYSKVEDKFVRCVHYVNGFQKVHNSAKFENFINDFAKDNVEFKEVSENAGTNSEALTLMRDSITSDADIQLVIGGMIGKGKSGIEKEVELCISKGKSIYLLGGFGFNAKKLCDEYLTKEKFKLLNNGLTLYENRKLANMYDIGEILKLIFKGWRSIEILKKF